MVIFKYHIGSNNLYSYFKSKYWNSEYISVHIHFKLMESNEDIEDIPRETDKWSRYLEAALNECWYRSIFIWPNERQTRWNSAS